MELKAYAAYYDNEVRKQSSSGGIFSLLASNFDVVYGVAMTNDCYGAQFVRTEKDISALRGSKYLQANVGKTFVDVEEDLKNKKSVLFTGSACQVNGLKKFLGKDYGNLFCVDVICHGVPSPELWRMYAKYQEKARGAKLQTVDFRCKENVCKNIDVETNSIFVFKDSDPYMQMFLRDYCLRPSCYHCKAKDKKLSDLTIADFWGIDSVASEMNDGKGTSLVIVRSEKGVELFENIKDSLVWKNVTYEEGVKQNPSEYSSSARPLERETFFKDMHAMSFDQLSKKYIKSQHVPLTIILKRKMRDIIGKNKNKIEPSWENYGLLLGFSSKNER